MKKLFIFVILICVLSFVVSATDVNPYIYEYFEQNLTIEFAENTTFSQNDRQRIADAIAYGDSMSQTYSLCWLLGHDEYVETVSAVYHKSSEYDQRCQLEIYDVTKCTNCDYVSPILIDSRYIPCCPPDTSIVSLDD